MKVLLKIEAAWPRCLVVIFATALDTFSGVTDSSAWYFVAHIAVGIFNKPSLFDNFNRLRGSKESFLLQPVSISALNEASNFWNVLLVGTLVLCVFLTDRVQRTISTSSSRVLSLEVTISRSLLLCWTNQWTSFIVFYETLRERSGICIRW